MKILRVLQAGLLILAAVLVPAVASAGGKTELMSTTNSLIGGASSATGLAGSADLCWKSSYGRGVAGIPDTCGTEEMQAGLCYPKCRPGYKGVGVVCWQDCPAGYRDDGLTCAKTTWVITRPVFTMGTDYSYAELSERTGEATRCRNRDDGADRGQLVFWDANNYNNKGPGCWKCPAGFGRTGKPVYDEQACSRADSGNSQCTAWAKDKFGTDGCEQIGALLYPKPPAGTSCTANSCMQNCPPGYRDDGIACAKATNYSRNVRTPACRAGLENQAGLCYNSCKAGYDGVGAVCWGKCTGDFPFECGAGCATNELACALAITEQVVGVLDVVVTTIETAGTLGAGTAANMAIKTAIKSGVKAMVKELLKDATKKFGEKTLKAALKKEMKALAKDTAIGMAEGQADNLVNLMTGEEFDPTTLDPTGISGMVKNFIKPICGDPSQGGTAVQTPNTMIQNAVQAASGKVWQQMPGLANDIGMGGGVLWHIGTNVVPGGFGIYRWDGKNWVTVPGGAVRIDVDGKGYAFIANEAGEMFRYNGTGWTKLPGLAKDVGVGEDGTLWCIGTDAVPGGYSIYRWNTTKNDWVKMKRAGAVRIDVSARGDAWTVNDAGQVFVGTTGLPGVLARDIGIGPDADGSVFVTAKDDGSVYKFDRSSYAWIKRDGQFDAITVDGRGVPFGANASKQIWMGYK